MIMTCTRFPNSRAYSLGAYAIQHDFGAGWSKRISGPTLLLNTFSIFPAVFDSLPYNSHTDFQAYTMELELN